MEVIVKYSDFNEIIKEVEIPISTDQKKTIRIEEVDDGTNTGNTVSNVVMETVDETMSFTVTQNMNKLEMRDFIQVLQKIVSQMK